MKTQTKIEVPIKVNSSFGASLSVSHFDISKETELIRIHLKVKELKAILEELMVKARNNSILPHDAIKIECHNIDEYDPVKSIFSVLMSIMLAAYDKRCINIQITTKEKSQNEI